MCWNKRITAISASTWREVSRQEQQERMHATERETMVKIRLAITFIIAQVALTKYYTSRRSANITVEDRAVRCNRNTEANCLSNTLQGVKCEETSLQPNMNQKCTAMQSDHVAFGDQRGEMILAMSLFSHISLS